MCDVKDFQVPHTIVAAGQHLLKGVKTGTTFGAVTDDNGNDRHLSFRVGLVPDVSTNLFSVTAGMQKERRRCFIRPTPDWSRGTWLSRCKPVGWTTRPEH